LLGFALLCFAAAPSHTSIYTSRLVLVPSLVTFSLLSRVLFCAPWFMHKHVPFVFFFRFLFVTCVVFWVFVFSHLCCWLLALFLGVFF
jgi:hypothetical protein